MKRRKKKKALFVVIISDWWHLLISKNIKTQRLYLLEFRPVRRICALGRATPAAAEKYCKASLYCPTCSVWTVMVFSERPTRPY